MMTHAYSQLYLNKSSRAVGNMLHDAVLEFGMNGAEFLKLLFNPTLPGRLKAVIPNTLQEKAVWNCFWRSWRRPPDKAIPQTSLKATTAVMCIGRVGC